MRRVFLPIQNIPIVANVPSTVAAEEETTAMRSVFFMALHSSGLLGLVKIETYDSKLKPLSKLNLLVLKKENSMTNRIGAYMIASII